MFEPLFHTWCRERFSRLARLRKAFARFALTVFGLALSVPTFAVGTTNTNIAINTASSILDTQTAFITVNVNNPTTFGTTPTGTISLNQSFNGTPTFGIGC